jgi:hypothetical protein
MPAPLPAYAATIMRLRPAHKRTTLTNPHPKRDRISCPNRRHTPTHE